METDYIYKILVVDDEQPARAILQQYISKIPSLKLVASCPNAVEATAVMHNERVDILLSDIQMPEMSGVDFISHLPYKTAVIFTTAYSSYALDGYDLGVVDYLLKPIPFPRFLKAINKAVEYCQLKKVVAEELVGAKVAQASPQPTDTENAMGKENAIGKENAMGKENQSGKENAMGKDSNIINIKADRRLYRIKLEDILYLEGQHEYVTFHTKKQKITGYYTLKSLEETLPQDKFIRIHKSYIVSLEALESIQNNSVTINGTELPLSPSFKDALLAKIM